MLWTYRGVVNNDIAGSHIAMEGVFFQVLDKSALKNKEKGEVSLLESTIFLEA